jgi:hypothetical protein
LWRFTRSTNVLLYGLHVNHLVGLGIAKQVTGKRRARLFGYSCYLKILGEGTEFRVGRQMFVTH